MKKIFITLLIISAICFGTVSYSQVDNSKTVNAQAIQNKHEQMRKQFEERLGLTKKQKEQAKKIHEQGLEKMKPVMMQLAMRRNELKSIGLSELNESERNIKKEELQKEITELEKQAHDIRKKNSQEFEKILNKEQRATLEKMKAEGRQRFEKNHQAKHPFQGLGTPNLFFKPLLP